ncbi:MAG: DUF1893 domain-containing protein [Candidatus Bathyarchaeia archaeon]
MLKMERQDLILAKKRLLNEKGITLSIVKNGEIIFECSSSGISGFLEAIEKLGEKLEDASVADTIVGKAIAFLCAYAEVKNVYAVILSKMAKEILEKHKIYHEREKLVENIMDFEADMCPFEKLTAEISNPSEAYKRLKALQNSLKHG